ncbi:oxygen-independent coproporphyrinogen III oxidase [Horticoccus luteus]|uniref:Coproporphyrinogen-III oxidase n=1 Tax=Horticoccus luteus TaxID=2862869 RepID=A0A8F9TW73_9BACT|nr:oxygen-independent coproporphyrinogen III oxidase [Horticoccus luteus]QYM78888.1 oxygen-independent coproporphyrinogen III oxidase [Horticoccus luteus]
MLGRATIAAGDEWSLVAVAPMRSFTMITVDLDLVRKYDISAPRYTSYPSATEFRDYSDPQPLLEHVERSNRDASLPLSLYYHLPFCETLCWFCGCTTVITLNHKSSDAYLDYLEKEVGLLAPRVHPDRLVTQLHYGGGTPTFFQPHELKRLDALTRRHFKFAPQAELSVEVDPRRLSHAQVVALRASGFTRASLGVQDFNPKVQEAVHRIQPRALTEQTIAWLRTEGFTSLNLDLIYGLPYQTVDTFRDTLEQVLELEPDRLAVFSYAHVPWMKPAQKILERESALPTPETKLAMLKLITETLTSRGYDYIGMDHFAKHTDELAVAQRARTLQRNFQGYSTRAGAEILAFGMSAISQTPYSYRQNHKTLTGYYAALDRGALPIARGRELTEDDRRRREIIMRLMCHLALDYGALAREFGDDFVTQYAAEIARLRPLVDDGMVVTSAEGLVVTERGRLFLRNIATCFDAYRTEGTGRHSRTI